MLDVVCIPVYRSKLRDMIGLSFFRRVNVDPQNGSLVHQKKI